MLIAVQIKAFKRKSDSLQTVINKLTLRLYSKEQEMQLRMRFGVDGCGQATNTQPATLQSADVGVFAPHSAALPVLHLASWPALMGWCLATYTVSRPV